MKKALIIANTVSMIDLFNKDNINILQSLGYKVFVACNFSRGNVTDNKRIDSFKIFLLAKSIEFFNLTIPRNPMDLKSIISSYKSLTKIAKLNFSIVHCHSPIASALTRLVFDKYRKTSQTRVIYSAHGFHFFKGSSILSWLVYYPIEKMLSNKTDLILTINSEDYILAKSSFNSKVEYVPGIGIDLKRFGKKKSFEEKKIIDKDQSSIFIGSIGQISKRKNHFAILKAIKMINNPNIHYFIAGFGELENKLVNYANKYNLHKNFHILGFLNDVPGFLNQMDIFAFPSLQEGLPVSLMEAMANATPVIASRIRGNTDLLGENYLFYINPSDTKNISNTINKMIVEIKKDKSQFNLTSSLKLFDINHIHNLMFKIYSKI